MKKKNANVKRLQEKINTIKQMHDCGLNATEIAARLGLSESTVRCHIGMIEKRRNLPVTK